MSVRVWSSKLMSGGLPTFVSSTATAMVSSAQSTYRRAIATLRAQSFLHLVHSLPSWYLQQKRTLHQNIKKNYAWYNTYSSILINKSSADRKDQESGFVCFNTLEVSIYLTQCCCKPIWHSYHIFIIYFLRHCFWLTMKKLLDPTDFHCMV